MAQFDERADAFLTALVAYQAEVNNWTDAFNAESQNYADKFYSRDSQLSNLENEVNNARSGYENLAARLQSLVSQVQDLVLSQNALSLSDIQVQRMRRPSPDDDGYAVGVFWLYDDDFWLCASSESAHAKWRRSDGTMIRRLDPPSISGPGSAATYGDVVISLSDLDADAQSIEWDFDGSPTVLDGATSGSLQQTITVEWTAAGEYSVRARGVGDNDDRYTSMYASVINVLVGPSLYCGAGNYCGDGSYPGMMPS
jgi:hypothetical protein